MGALASAFLDVRLILTFGIMNTLPANFFRAAPPDAATGIDENGAVCVIGDGSVAMRKEKGAPPSHTGAIRI